MTEENIEISTTKCVCCDQEIKNPMGSQIYCISCSLHNGEKNRKIGNLKHHIQVLTIKISKLQNKIERLKRKVWQK